MSGWSVRVDRISIADGPVADVARDGQTFVIEDSRGYLVNRAARLLAHELADRLRPAGVGIGQWAVLLFL